jgi:hypothetical protein
MQQNLDAVKSVEIYALPDFLHCHGPVTAIRLCLYFQIGQQRLSCPHRNQNGAEGIVGILPRG